MPTNTPGASETHDASETRWPVLHLPLPPAWKAALEEAAEHHGLTRAGMARLYLGDALRDRIKRPAA